MSESSVQFSPEEKIVAFDQIAEQFYEKNFGSKEICAILRKYYFNKESGLSERKQLL